MDQRETEENATIHAAGPSGALTSGDRLPVWQCPLSLIEAFARRAKKGNDKGYPIHNWRSGLDDVAFLRDRANHAATHLMRLLNGDNSVDDAQGNLDAIVFWCGLMSEALRLSPNTVVEAFYDEPRGEQP